MLGENAKKRRSTEDEENNGAEPANAELVESIEKLQEVQDELEKINEQASEEVLVIEQKFNEKRKPVYDKRNATIQTIPDFWFTAFMSHPALGELLTEEDRKILKYLNCLEVEDFKDVKSGYSIKFKFNPNPYFEDTELTKTFHFLEGETKITATSIKWKEGMGIPHAVAEGKKGKKRSHVEESFFTWFTDAEHKEEGYEIQDEVADIIKDDLWPNPIQYFNNDADEEGLVMDDDSDDDDDDENGTEDDDDDEQEDEDGAGED